MRKKASNYTLHILHISLSLYIYICIFFGSRTEAQRIVSLHFIRIVDRITMIPMDGEDGEKATKMVKVLIQDLGGKELEETIETTETIGCLRSMIAKSWNLNPRSFHLIFETTKLKDATQISSLGEEIMLQLMKSLHELGEFEAGHEGIEIRSGGSTIIKTSHEPDSNNVFLRYPICEPCFVEFQIIRAGDEMSIGVTYDERVAAVSGFGNLGLKSTFIYSKKKSMPVFLFGGKRENPRDQKGIRQGDVVAIYADPLACLVRFYSNGLLVGLCSELPPSDGRALRAYVMLDFQEDEVSVLRYGAGDPYPEGEAVP